MYIKYRCFPTKANSNAPFNHSFSLDKLEPYRIHIIIKEYNARETLSNKVYLLNHNLLPVLWGKEI